MLWPIVNLFECGFVNIETLIGFLMMSSHILGTSTRISSLFGRLFGFPIYFLFFGIWNSKVLSKWWDHFWEYFPITNNKLFGNLIKSLKKILSPRLYAPPRLLGSREYTFYVIENIICDSWLTSNFQTCLVSPFLWVGQWYICHLLDCVNHPWFVIIVRS